MEDREVGRRGQLAAVYERIAAVAEGEDDAIALMATMACELYQGVASYDWVGFYRRVGPETLKVGPYQGMHGCLTIRFSQGICGRCAASGEVQNIPDVRVDPAHLACSATTRSELVVPVRDAAGSLIAVLDIDSDRPANFSDVDVAALERMLQLFAR